MTNRLVEHLFFFGLLGVAAYLMWAIIEPFVGALVLAAILATVCYPTYTWVIAHLAPRRNRSIAALLTILLVTVVVLVPLSLVIYLLVSEVLTFYSAIDSGSTLSVEEMLGSLQGFVQQFIPSFSLDIAHYTEQAVGWLASNVQSIFAGTVATVFLLFIAFIGLFYFFRDGETFTKHLVYLSPLPDEDDTQILHRLAQAVRSVVLGTLSVALIQGTLTAVGLSIFGVEQAILLGSVAGIGALIPGVGTSIVFIPVVIYMAIAGSYGAAIGLALWGMLAVGLVDNMLGPYLMTRKAPLHPFFVLISVLGGIAFFGPIGFVLGPVVLSFFKVLLELYSTHLAPPSMATKEPQ